MIKDHPRCSVGGDYWALPNGEFEYQERCTNPVVARYQTKATENPEHWNYRCLDHVGWLDIDHVKIESLEEAHGKTRRATEPTPTETPVHSTATSTEAGTSTTETGTGTR
jgi:hypothetical protein